MKTKSLKASRMSNTLWAPVALAVTALALANPSAHATTVVNVDFQNVGNTTYSGVGVAPDLGTTWNPVNLGATGQALLNSVGGASGISLTLVGGHGYWGVAGAADDVTRDYIFGWTGGTQTATVNLSGLTPNIAFDLHLYARGDGADQNPLITLAAANGGASGTASALSGGALPFSLANNHVLLTGNADGSGNVSFAFSLIGSNAFWAANGFQLVAIPEPSAALLGGLGMLALLRFRRR